MPLIFARNLTLVFFWGKDNFWHLYSSEVALVLCCTLRMGMELNEKSSHVYLKSNESNEVFTWLEDTFITDKVLKLDFYYYFWHTFRRRKFQLK